LEIIESEIFSGGRIIESGNADAAMMTRCKTDDREASPV